MIMTAVITKNYEAPPIRRREILKYSSVRGPVPRIDALLDECLSELSGLTYKVCFCRIPTDQLWTDSDSLKSHLEGCEWAVVLAATVGIAIDRLIARYAPVSPTKALLFQAIGAERIESLCDAFEEDLKKDFPIISKRFSPGYGDLPLDYQRRIFSILDCHKRIGLTVNESLIMSPSKSVTAIIGVKGSN